MAGLGMKKSPTMSNSTTSRSIEKTESQTDENVTYKSRKGMLRVALGLSLIAAVVLCSVVSFQLLSHGEEQIGWATYESIANSALINAQSITKRKLQGSEVMATLMAQTHPDPADWPWVDLPGYIPIAAKVAELSSSNTQSLMVFVKPEEALDFQDHIYQVYREQGRPESAGVQEFGFGIYKTDRDTESPTYQDGRLPDVDGTNDWGGNQTILAPLALHNIPGASSLLYNTYSDEDRGIHLDAMLDCVERSRLEQLQNGTSLQDMIAPKCAVVTDVLTLQIRPGPAGLLFQPIYPEKNQTHLVGFATTSIHWEEVLLAIVPDYVSGLTCVVSTDTSAHSFEIRNGQPVLLGSGDLHDEEYTPAGKSVILNEEIETGTQTSALYKLTVYPTRETFAPFRSQLPVFISLGFAGAILLCASLFVLYDWLTRLEAAQNLSIVKQLKQENRRQANDAIWNVKKEELQFDDPPKVIGQGSFGRVLLAKYRGTDVAVKRVMNPHTPGATPRTIFDVSQSNHEIDGTLSMASLAIKSGMGSWAGIGMKSFGMNHAAVKDTHDSNTSTTQSRVANDEELRALKKEFEEEIRYLCKLRHPCIACVLGAVIDDECQDQMHDPMLVMEYMDLGSLYDILHNETMALDGEIILPILRDISQGMLFLHAANPPVLHGDLKAANILVNRRYHASVSDFGLSQKKTIGGTGTPFWMAPELLRQESANTSASDVFAFGVILYECYSRQDPYEGENAREVLMGIMDKNVCKRVQAPRNMPAPIKLLMEDCLQEDPEKRPSFQEIDSRLKRIDAETATPTDARTKSQVSLSDIFPEHIAAALKSGRKVEAEQKDSVAIFFSDIVGFTDISGRLEPRKVADMLGRLYCKFDYLSSKYDLYKVETIGDAFMAATNLVKDQNKDHCKRIAQFSMEAIAAANQTPVDLEDPSQGTINIRVGFHVGSVVADVVGALNPRYCLFGDAVNTASRMESNSEANRINCSDDAAELLREQWPQVPLIDRGEIPIKGKGMMRCFWVTNGASGTEVITSNSMHNTNSRHKLAPLPMPALREVESGMSDFPASRTDITANTYDSSGEDYASLCDGDEDYTDLESNVLKTSSV